MSQSCSPSQTGTGLVPSPSLPMTSSFHSVSLIARRMTPRRSDIGRIRGVVAGARSRCTSGARWILVGVAAPTPNRMGTVRGDGSTVGDRFALTGSARRRGAGASAIRSRLVNTPWSTIVSLRVVGPRRHAATCRPGVFAGDAPGVAAIDGAC